jgi:Mn-dependent DtxR family transcriptional regulator
MSHKTTPDERLLIKLYETALAAGDPCGEVDVRPVAKLLGLKETAVKNILKHLAQANFIKKVDANIVCLTKRGCEFVLENR